MQTSFVFLFVLWHIFSVAAITPARAQDSNGPSPIGFLDTSDYRYDYLVDSSLAQDDPANRRYRTLQTAYAAAPEGTPAKPTVIGIKPDVYHFTSETRAPDMAILKNYITLVGLTNDHRNVVLADNRGHQQGASTDGQVIVVDATGFTAINLTFLNYCNLNYEYPGDPSKNLKARSGLMTQAVAFQAAGDKHVYDHVAFLSLHDTTYLRITRAYFKNVYIEGTIHFIGGGVISVWDHSVIHFPTGTAIPAILGAVFLNSTFTKAPGVTVQMYAGIDRPAAFINCLFPVNQGQSLALMRGAAPRPTLYTLTYHNKDANGNPAVIPDSLDGPTTFALSREMSDQEVQAFNPWNLLRATPTGAADDWDPAGARPKYEAMGQGNLVYRMAITPTFPSIITGRAGATIRGSVSPVRATQTITWSTSSNLISLSNTKGPSTVVTGRNTTGKAQYAPVMATAANGFYVTAWVYVQPAYLDPPAFSSRPELSPTADGKIVLRYRLIKAEEHTDQSIITWFSCVEPTCAEPRTVAVSRWGIPSTTYTLAPGDLGKYIRATIQPKLDISDPGPAVTSTTAAPIPESAIAWTAVSPDFMSFVTTENPSYVDGYWTVVGTWTPVSGSAYGNAYGIRVGSRGAALLYQSGAPHGDMQIDVVMSPERVDGEGFGSANIAEDTATQEADIYIKYDPRTRAGYSLRWWRAARSNVRCIFQLYQHKGGMSLPVSPLQVLSGVFKPNTYVTLSIAGSTFSAKAHNDFDGETLSLSSIVSPNPYGGAGVSWTGTVQSSNVYSFFRISYATDSGVNPRVRRRDP